MVSVGREKGTRWLLKVMSLSYPPFLSSYSQHHKARLLSRSVTSSFSVLSSCLPSRIPRRNQAASSPPRPWPPPLVQLPLPIASSFFFSPSSSSSSSLQPQPSHPPVTPPLSSNSAFPNAFPNATLHPPPSPPQTSSFEQPVGRARTNASTTA